MTHLAVRVIARCRSVLDMAGFSGRFHGGRVLVLVMAEMGLALLMPADARGCSPAPLERQQHHHEDEDEATHDRGMVSADV